MQHADPAFERALAERERGLRETGHSRWIDIGRTVLADGTVIITALRDPITGEVRQAR